MVKPVQRFMAEDGMIFETRAQAQRHEKLKELENEFPTIYGPSEGCKIYFEDFRDWLENDGGENWLRQYLYKELNWKPED